MGRERKLNCPKIHKEQCEAPRARLQESPTRKSTWLIVRWGQQISSVACGEQRVLKPAFYRLWAAIAQASNIPLCAPANVRVYQ